MTITGKSAAELRQRTVDNAEARADDDYRGAELAVHFSGRVDTGCQGFDERRGIVVHSVRHDITVLPRSLHVLSIGAVGCGYRFV